MRILLDTHVLLWSIAASRKLPGDARALIEAPENEVYFSPASLWEIAIKAELGRKDFRVDVAALYAALAQTGFAEVPIRAVHAVALARLPDVHRDPFDRMLVAQALTEPLVLLTNDETLSRYPVSIRLL
jgi:PIN domain nuclease of toxin-antitoxin system